MDNNHRFKDCKNYKRVNICELDNDECNVLDRDNCALREKDKK